MTAYSVTTGDPRQAPLTPALSLYGGAGPSLVAAGDPGRWTVAALVPSAVARPDRLARYATRVQSPAVRDALALAATGGTWGADELETLVRDGVDVVGRRPGAGALAWAAVALAWAARTDGSGLLPAAEVYARLARTEDVGVLPRHHHVVAAQVQYLAGRPERVRPMLERYEAAPDVVREALLLDLERPTDWDRGAAGDTAAEAAWGRHLASFVFGGHPDIGVGVDPCSVDVAPFDRLRAQGHRPASVSGELVTVVVPSYRPDAPGMRLAVRSVLEQTWADLEVLVVDDASGPGFDDLYGEVAAMDERVRVVRMPDNGGSYVGRNAAMRLARGSALTFQDSDDWSHPRRVEDQMAALASAPPVGASRSDALRAREDLSHQWLGYLPVRPNASSLMLSRRAIEALGDFLPIRRGADSEYAERVRAAGGEIVDTGSVLAVTRLRSGSLSRGDFSFQWTTPQRLAFKGLFRSWHAHTAPERLRVDAADGLPFPVPSAFVVHPEDRVLDVVVAADLSLPVETVLGPVADPGTRVPPSDCLTLDGAWSAQRAAVLREAMTAAAAGATVGLWHTEAPSRRKGRSEMHPSWFALVTDGPFAAVVSGDERLGVRRLVVPDPRYLAVDPGDSVVLAADVVELRVPPSGDLPADARRSDVDLEVVGDAVARARRRFGDVVRVVDGASTPGPQHS